MDPERSGHIIAHTGQGYVSSDDGGQTWERFESPIDLGSAGSYAVIAVDLHDPSVWWLSLRGVWRSIGRGDDLGGVRSHRRALRCGG